MNRLKLMANFHLIYLHRINTYPSFARPVSYLTTFRRKSTRGLFAPYGVGYGDGVMKNSPVYEFIRNKSAFSARCDAARGSNE